MYYFFDADKYVLIKGENESFGDLHFLYIDYRMLDREGNFPFFVDNNTCLC